MESNVHLQIMSDYNLHYTSYPKRGNNIMSSKETYEVLRFSIFLNFIHIIMGSAVKFSTTKQAWVCFPTNRCLIYLQLFTATVSNSDYTVSKQQIMNRKGCGRKKLWPNLRHYPRICLEGLRKTTDLSQNTVLPKMGTGHLQNTSQKCHHSS
jgi:hypothetical protein